MTLDLIWTVLGVIVPILGAFVLMRVVHMAFNHHQKIWGEQLHIHILYRIIQAFVWIIAISMALQQFKGFQSAMNTLLASSGIVALGISLAAQESLQNIIDGVILQIFKPFDIGDRVTLPEKGLTGNVTEMNLRHTVITTYNNTKYILQNKQISQAVIENSSQGEDIAYPLDVSITYDQNIDKAIEVLRQVVYQNKDFLDKRTEQEKKDGIPPVKILVTGFGDSGINLRATVVTKDIGTSFQACQDIRVALKKAYDENGIQFPFNTITIDNIEKIGGNR